MPNNEKTAIAPAAGTKTSGSPNPEPKDFESAMNELDGIVQKMEDATLPLADALKQYKRGEELLAYCQKTLAAAEQQVKILENGAMKDFVDVSRRENA
jgi:exodeoxyribonuclease VII small subunit